MKNYKIYKEQEKDLIPMELKKICCFFKPVKSQNIFLPVDTSDKIMNSNTKKGERWINAFSVPT